MRLCNSPAKKGGISEIYRSICFKVVIIHKVGKLYYKNFTQQYFPLKLP